MLNGNSFHLRDDVKAKHKFFIADLDTNADIIMYGTLVGKLQCNVLKGQVMTTNNTKHAAGKYSYRAHQFRWKAPDVAALTNKTFKGYKGNDGRVGTANYWLFIPTVFCENRNLDVIKEAMWNELGYAVTDKYKSYMRQVFQAYKSGEDIENVNLNPVNGFAKERFFRHVDGIKFLNHAGGCGGTRQGAARWSSLLAAYADHPNVGGVTILSLGCQHLQVKNLLNDLKQRNPSFNKPLYVFEQQQIQSEEQLIAGAIRQTFKGLVEINKEERQPAPLSDLC